MRPRAAGRGRRAVRDEVTFRTVAGKNGLASQVEFAKNNPMRTVRSSSKNNNSTAKLEQAINANLEGLGYGR